MISKLFLLCFVALAQSGHLSQTYNNPWTSYNPQNNAPGALYVEQHVPIIINGVPVETKEVQEAKAQHFAAIAQAKELEARELQKDNYNNQYKAGSYQSAPIYEQPAWFNGNNEEQSLNKWNAYTESSSQHGHRYRRSILSYGYHNQHVPVITNEGVPVETPEVLQAKALHQQAYQNAKLSHNDWKSSQIVEDESVLQNAYNGWTPKSAVNKVSYTVNHGNNYGWQKLSHEPQYIPVLGKDGVPLDTAEVQLAKQQHLLAHQQAELNKHGLQGNTQYLPVTSQYYQHVPSLTTNGVPVETSEVQIAKAQHLAAHQAEQAKHSVWAGSNHADSYNYDDSLEHTDYHSDTASKY